MCALYNGKVIEVKEAELEKELATLLEKEELQEFWIGATKFHQKWTDGGWRMVGGGGWRMVEDGGWRMVEDGGWRMVGGGWWVEDRGGWGSMKVVSGDGG